jgi:hypothetical protein
MLVALTVSFAADAIAFSCNATLCVAPPELAAIVAVCDVLTAETFALNPAEVAPAGTVIEAGTSTVLLLLATVTTWPVLGAAAFNVTVQLSVAAPLMEVDAQFKLLILTWFVPVL